MKFNYKHVTATFLTACFLLSGNAYAVTLEEIQEQPQNSLLAVTETKAAEQFLSSNAIVKDIASVEDRYVVTVTLTNESEQEVMLKLSEDTLVLDNKSGACINVEDLEVGSEIVAYYSAAMTRSLPPQTNCVAIVTNVEDGETKAKYMTVGEIEISDDGQIKLWNADGSYILTIREGAEIISAVDGAELTADDIQEGSRIFSWFDIMLMSYPGQAGTDRISVAPAVEAEETEESAEAEEAVEPAVELSVTEFNKIILNGEEIDLTELPLYISDNNIIMLPLRPVSEALGFTVTWNDEDFSIDLDDGEVKTTIRIGEDSYYKASSEETGLTLAASVGAAPELKDARTYVPSDLFNILYSSDSVTVTDGVLTITK